MNTLRPGEDSTSIPSTLDTSAAYYTDAAAAQSATQFILHIIPRTFADAFSGDDMLQVLLIAVLFGYALTRLGRRGEAVHQVLTQVSHVFFGMMNVVMKLAPLRGAAMAFTLGAYGLAALMPLGWLLAGYYLTCFILSLGFSAALPHGPDSACGGSF